MSRPCSLTVVFADGDKGISGAEFGLLRVGDALESGGFKLSGDFARYGVTLEGLDSSGWRAAAQTLAAYARRDGIAPDSRAETGRDGRALFDSLTPGLYLVTGERTVSGGRVYTPEPFLVSLPGAGEDGEWDYSVAARCKFDDEPKPPDGDTVDVKVLKIWRGDGRAAAPGGDNGSAPARRESVRHGHSQRGERLAPYLGGAGRRTQLAGR